MSVVDKDYCDEKEKNIKMLENKWEKSQLSKKHSDWSWHLTVFLPLKHFFFEHERFKQNFYKLI